MDCAEQLLKDCGQSFAALKQSALSKDFRPVALGATANFHLDNEVRTFQSRNVLARLEGSDPDRRDDLVLYTAHWDHLGQRTEADGEQKIFRGAIDNASGVGALIELARAFTSLASPPRSSVVFMAPTAEESGLLGAHYYASSPLYPLKNTLADINIDGVNPLGQNP